MKEKIIVSGCILGDNTKYNGGNNYQPLIEKIKEKYDVIAICPEVMGGLSTPRNPSEIKGDKVFSNKNVDVTLEFKSGALMALALAVQNDCKIAVLKEGSPSCGANYVYDGTFTGTKINGMGVTAKLFKENNITIYTEHDIEKLLK